MNFPIVSGDKRQGINYRVRLHLPAPFATPFAPAYLASVSAETRLKMRRLEAPGARPKAAKPWAVGRKIPRALFLAFQSASG
jgi:hypothetical protein